MVNRLWVILLSFYLYSLYFHSRHHYFHNKSKFLSVNKGYFFVILLEEESANTGAPWHLRGEWGLCSETSENPRFHWEHHWLRDECRWAAWLMQAIRFLFVTCFTYSPRRQVLFSSLPIKALSDSLPIYSWKQNCEETTVGIMHPYHQQGPGR